MVIRWTAAVFVVTLIVYFSLPTKNYYWDGIAFARDIESVDRDTNPGILFHPNHLLYNAGGYAAWKVARQFDRNIRALAVLQLTNSILAAGSVALLFRLMIEAFRSRYIAACFSLIFAFSATWWKFSTDANSYISSVFFLLVTSFTILPRETTSDRPNIVVPAFTYAASVLLHQLAVLFYPAAVLGIWYRRRRIAPLIQFSLMAGLMTLTAYYAAFYFYRDTYHAAKFADWLTWHSSDSSFSFDFGRNLLAAAISHVRVFVGGRLALVRQSWGVLMALAIAASAGCTAIMFQRLRGLSISRPLIDAKDSPLVRVAAAWIGAYLVFLLFWLPNNSFYRLFYLPAVILIAGAVANSQKGDGRQRHQALASAAGFLFFFNFAFHIYPQAQIAANPLLEPAISMQKVWSQGAVVYWDVFNSNNTTVMYFNPRVVWKGLWGRVWIGDVEQTMQAAYASGGSLWFDSAALFRFAAKDQELRQWLNTRVHFGASHEFRVGDHTLGYVQVLPN
jgi:hypothetical protein